jgi:large subunit ribosomal protein L15
MLNLDTLSPLVKKRKRVGRGGSRGGTCGRGHKGQKARSGGSSVRRGFEGGQTNLVRRLPKVGFNNKEFQRETIVINLEQLERFFEPQAVVDAATLIERGLLKNAATAAIKILGKGTLTKKLTVHAHAFSKNALEAIQKSGGQAHIIGEK